METRQNHELPEELKGLTDEVDDEAEAPVKVLRAKLRPGYTFKVGDKVLYGPRIISIDEDTARENLHRFDNVGELRAQLGMKPTPKRLTFEEESEQRQNAIMQRQVGAGAAVQVEVVTAAVNGALNQVFDEMEKRGLAIEKSAKTPKGKGPKK